MDSNSIAMIIVAAFGMLSSVTVSIVSTISANKELKAEIQSVRTQIDTLTKQVEKHNSVIERTYKLEERADNMEKDVDRLLRKE